MTTKAPPSPLAGEGWGYGVDTFLLVVCWGACDMLNQAVAFGYRRRRMNDSLLCGPFAGGRDAGDGRSRSVFGPAAAKKGARLPERVGCQPKPAVQRLGRGESRGKGRGRFPADA